MVIVHCFRLRKPKIFPSVQKTSVTLFTTLKPCSNIQTVLALKKSALYTSIKILFVENIYSWSVMCDLQCLTKK